MGELAIENPGKYGDAVAVPTGLPKAEAEAEVERSPSRRKTMDAAVEMLTLENPAEGKG